MALIQEPLRLLDKLLDANRDSPAAVSLILDHLDEGQIRRVAAADLQLAEEFLARKQPQLRGLWESIPFFVLVEVAARKAPGAAFSLLLEISDPEILQEAGAIIAGTATTAEEKDGLIEQMDPYLDQMSEPSACHLGMALKEALEK